MASSDIFCGVDLGSQKTIIVASDGERILTSTGGTTRPTAVSFYERSRLLGEEAIPQLMSENTVTFLNTLLGAKYSDVMSVSDSDCGRFGFLPYTRMSLVPLGGSCADHSDSSVGVRVAYQGPEALQQKEEQGTVFSVPALLGMFLASLVEQVRSSYGEHNGYNPSSLRFVLSFPLPQGHQPEVARALKEACEVAGIALCPSSSAPTTDCLAPASMAVTTTTQSLARAYSRKLQGLKPAEKTHLEDGGRVLVVEMGCLQSTVVVLGVRPDLNSVDVISTECCASLGAFHFDLAIYRHLAQICETNHKLKIVPGTKAALRFLTSCERLRKLLSQLHEASVTVENLSDEVGDLTFTLRRDELASLCAPLMTRFKGLIADTLAAAGLSAGGGLAAVEVLGGGVRMQIVHEAIEEFSGALPLGAKLDDGSMAVGAALMAMPTPVEKEKEKEKGKEEETKKGSETEDTETYTEKTTEQEAPLGPEEEASWGLSDEDLRAAVAAETLMQQQDKDILRLLECRNEMEAYIFEMRSSCNQKHGALITDPDGLRSTCDEFENWLWDFGETMSLQEVLDKFASLKDKLEGPEAEVEVPGEEGAAPSLEKRRQGGLCSEYLTVVAREKAEVEKTLAEEAAQAALEQGGEDKDDHDFRKLRKPERMRLVMKNKEEGTELFKGGNIRPAAARYQKALTHAAKFFDLSPEDTEEVSAVKLSLHLNLTQCYLKLENWDSAIRHADEALALDAKAVKALFRRAQAWEARKEYDKALADMKQAAELNAPKEDKLITKGMERVNKLIQKEKKKEKKMWGKAFS